MSYFCISLTLFKFIFRFATTSATFGITLKRLFFLCYVNFMHFDYIAYVVKQRPNILHSKNEATVTCIHASELVSGKFEVLAVICYIAATSTGQPRKGQRFLLLCLNVVTLQVFFEIHVRTLPSTPQSSFQS